MDVITIQNLWKSYRVGGEDLPVLKGISLAVRRGELAALTGPSGCGKSTLMNTLGCLDRPSSGEYWLDGTEVSALSADARAVVRGQKIGFVFQNFSLLPRTSALDNVLMPMTYAIPRPDPHASRQRAVELLERVGLGERLDHHPSQLSGGQQQRVAIARSLINNPSVLLADEPTGNLDSKTSVEILGMFRQLNREEGLTILLVTHDPDVAATANRVIRLRDGVVESGAFPE